MSTNVITCGEFESFLEAYVRDELSQEMRLKFDNHMQDCAGCDAYLRGYTISVALAKQLCDDDDAAPPADVPEDLLSAVIGALPDLPRADS